MNTKINPIDFKERRESNLNIGEVVPEYKDQIQESRSSNIDSPEHQLDLFNDNVNKMSDSTTTDDDLDEDDEYDDEDEDLDDEYFDEDEVLDEEAYDEDEDDFDDDDLDDECCDEDDFEDNDMDGDYIKESTPTYDSWNNKKSEKSQDVEKSNESNLDKYRDYFNKRGTVI